jgi:D-alanine-D-alanine ligase
MAHAAYNLGGVEVTLAELRSRLKGRRGELRALRIVVLAGGGSSEREVSLRSGRAVASALGSLGYRTDLLQLAPDNLSIETREAVALPLGATNDGPSAVATRTEVESNPSALSAIRQADVVFTMLHGSAGENGAWQGLLDLAQVPYVSAGVKGSALAMDKIVTKRLFESLGIPTPRWWVHDGGPGQTSLEIPRGIKDLVAKPPSEGSSVGVTMFPNDLTGWDEVDRLCSTYGRLLIEERIWGREMTIGVIGPSDRGTALPIVEIVASGDYYDYEAKYGGQSNYDCPASLPAFVAELIASAATEIYEEFDLAPFARIDFMLDQDNKYYFLEANTLPGFTEHSLLPMAARAAGIEMGELLELLMLCAIERHEAKRGTA